MIFGVEAGVWAVSVTSVGRVAFNGQTPHFPRSSRLSHHPHGSQISIFCNRRWIAVFGGWLIFYAANVPLVNHDSSRPTDYKRKKYPGPHNLK